MAYDAADKTRKVNVIQQLRMQHHLRSLGFVDELKRH